MRSGYVRRASSPNAVIVVLCMVGIVAALGGTLLVPLVSRLPEIYDVSAVPASWIITSTLLAGALATPILTRLADMFGARLIIVATLIGLVLGSLLLAISDSFALAIVGRSLQGVAAALVPVAMSLMKHVLPPERVGFGVALMSGTLGAGSALGLPLAGFMYTHLGWSSLFWGLAILGALLAFLVWTMLPKRVTESKQSIDWFGALLLTVALTPLILVVTQGNVWGWLSRPIIGLTLLSLVAFLAWVPWERRQRDPIVHLGLLVLRPVALTNIVAIIIAMAMLINLFLAGQQLAVPEFVAGGLGLSADATGLVMAFPAGAVAAASPLAARLLRRFGGRWVLIAGALFMAASYVARILLDGSVFEIALGAVLVCVGTCLALSAMPMIIMAAVPSEHTASANGINTLCRMLGTSLSTAGMAAVTSFTAVTFDGTEYPTTETYHLLFWACVVLSMTAALLTTAIPRRDRLPDGHGGLVTESATAP
ncbi:MFS transporter [Acrocarpospora macrocephala]|nr:MFS transporter [Acrocarpospora macrocephala]